MHGGSRKRKGQYEAQGAVGSARGSRKRRGCMGQKKVQRVHGAVGIARGVLGSRKRNYISPMSEALDGCWSESNGS